MIDQDITPQELERLTDDLQKISAQQSNLVLADLATNLLAFFSSEHLHIVPEKPAWYQRLWARLQDWWNKHVTRKRHRLLLAFGLILPELISLIELLLLMMLLLLPTETIQAWAKEVFTSAELGSLNDPRWVVIRLILDSVTGVLAIAAGILWVPLSKHRASASYILLSLALFVLPSIPNWYVYAPVWLVAVQLTFMVGVLSWVRHYLNQRKIYFIL